MHKQALAITALLTISFISVYQRPTAVAGEAASAIPYFKPFKGL